MNTVPRNQSEPFFTTAYLTRLPREERLHIISLLADSLREEKPKTPQNSLAALCASFGEDWKDVDAEQLRSGRIFNRIVETW